MQFHHRQVNDDLASGQAFPESPISGELDSLEEPLIFSDEHDILLSEDTEHSSNHSKSDEGEEVWEEADSLTKECPELPDDDLYC